MKKTYLFKILVSIWILFPMSNGFSGEGYCGSVFNYKGIPGCECFTHCTCYRSAIESIRSPPHPQNSEDIVLHTFMEDVLKAVSVGPTLRHDRRSLCYELGYSDGYDLAMLSEYLNAIDVCKKIIDDEGNYLIQRWKKIYSSPNDAKDLQNRIRDIPDRVAKAKSILSSLPDKIIPLYKNILNNCPHRGSYNLALIYNEGLLGFITGDYESSLDRINEFIVFAETSGVKDRLLNSQIYQKQGESFLEVGLYHEAIAAFTKAIEKDPTNKEVYFDRATAYFEVGDFVSAEYDYVSSEAGKQSLEEPKVSSDFSSALVNAVLEGGKDAAFEFVPSLCDTAFGIGECLWCFTQGPASFTVNFCNACYDVGEAITEYIKNLDHEKVEELVDEVKNFYQRCDSLSNSEKGQALGYCIGKYGVDIFTGAATVKCVTAVKKLKMANRLCNLDAMVASKASKEAITTAALKHSVEREKYFKSVKIEFDSQNKHIIGKHNYIPEKGRSIFTYSDPQELIINFAGKGIAKNKVMPCMPGYVERVDFGKNIGFYINDKNPTIKLPTSKGTIKYSKKGAHIVPSNPDG